MPVMVCHDSWQNQFFGLDNPNAAPAVDPDADGQNNEFEYTAGVVPTDPASLFAFRIESVAGQPNQKNLIFNPRFFDRAYMSEYRTNLVSGSHETLTGTWTTDNGLERTVTDLTATETQKFYRIKITYP